MMHGMTAAEIQRQFGIPAANIRQWVQRGKVKRLPTGNIDLESLITWLDRNTNMDEYWRVPPPI